MTDYTVHIDRIIVDRDLTRRERDRLAADVQRALQERISDGPVAIRTATGLAGSIAAAIHAALPVTAPAGPPRVARARRGSR